VSVPQSPPPATAILPAILPTAGLHLQKRDSLTRLSATPSHSRPPPVKKGQFHKTFVHSFPHPASTCRKGTVSRDFRQLLPTAGLHLQKKDSFTRLSSTPSHSRAPPDKKRQFHETFVHSFPQPACQKGTVSRDFRLQIFSRTMWSPLPHNEQAQ
jgi:hypothetical protein